MTPGTRITFYVSSASVAASRFAWVEDPNGPWEDPTTGKRYRRTDESGENMGDGGGDGFSQFDVLAVDGDAVVVASSLLGIDRVASMYTAGPSSGGVVTGPVLDSVWVDPATLEQASTRTLPGTVVMRGPYPLGGKTYQAVGFATTDPARYQSYIYDHDSGLMLSAVTKMQGATSPLTPPDGQSPKGNTQLGQWILAGVRQRQTPGLGGSTPGWAQSRGSLTYQGTYVIGNPMSPATDPFTFPMTMDVTLRPLRGAWFAFQAVSTVQTQGMGPITASGVAGPTGPYWIDTAALTGLQAGQQIDVDPITKETVTVTAADQASVTFTSDMPGLQTSATYSRSSGAMTGYHQVGMQAGVTIALQLISPP